MPLWKSFDQFFIILHYFGGHSLIFNHLSNFRNVYINFQFLYAIWKMYSQISSRLMSFWECIHWFSIPLCYLGNVFTNFSLFSQMLKPYFTLCCYYWALSPSCKLPLHLKTSEQQAYIQIEMKELGMLRRTTAGSPKSEASSVARSVAPIGICHQYPEIGRQCQGCSLFCFLYDSINQCCAWV